VSNRIPPRTARRDTICFAANLQKEIRKLLDKDLDGYARLAAAGTNVPIVPSGNWVQDLPAYRAALGRGCWDRGRCDVVTMHPFYHSVSTISMVC
jgi:hypothetical protein